MLTGLVLPLVRLYLSLTLGVAGLAKLWKPGRFQETLVAIGLPRSGARVVAMLVIGVELVIAIGLWVRPLLDGAALVAALLFATFATLGALFDSRQVRCNCFGSLLDESLGWSTVIRNLPLLAGALLLALDAPAVNEIAMVELPAFLMTAVGLFLLEPVGRLTWGRRRA